jgi:gamma-glutamyltranspeptidase / glutathione hydrolase
MTLDAVQAQDRPPASGGGPMSQVIGRQWMVSAGHALAAQAAARILDRGGNAIDAGVAAGFMLGVVHPDMVSFGGVAPILVYLARSGETLQVSGVGPYPRQASAEFYRTRCGGEIPVGLLRTVVPASPASWCEALERWGTIGFAEAVAPALECAEEGFPLSVFTAYQIRNNAERYRQWPTSMPLYLPGGEPPRAGHRFVQSELAATIRLMMAAEAKAAGRAAGIRAARDVFYKGEVAQRIAAYHTSEGGLLALEDLAAFEVEVNPALMTSYRDYQIAACGFWCQGPVLLQMFNLVEGYDLRALGHNSPRYAHVLTECMKLAFADREAYYGDPAHAKVPADGLLSKVYAEARRTLVEQDRAWPDMPPAGDPLSLARLRNGSLARTPGGGPSEGLDTAYVAVVDGEGNGFSATPSDPSVDSPIVPGVGCVVSPRGSQGWLTPGHPSEVAPGKRPRLTPAPAMALREGRLFMAFGTPGGDVQQQAMLQMFLNVAEFGMLPQSAVEVPRFATRSFPDSFWPHGSAPGRLDVEQRIPASTRSAISALGHAVNDWPDWDWRAGAVCAVLAGRDGVLMAGADPRRGAHAIGW